MLILFSQAVVWYPCVMFVEDVTAITAFARRLRDANIHVPTVGVGSTPGCSVSENWTGVCLSSGCDGLYYRRITNVLYGLDQVYVLHILFGRKKSRGLKFYTMKISYVGL